MNCKPFLSVLGSVFILSALLLPLRAVAADGAIPEDSNAAVLYAYFRIGDETRDVPGISAEDFKEQIAEMTDKDNGYHVASLDEIIKAQEKNTPLPPKTVALTFEGTDSSFIRNAFPVLEDAGLPFTLFVSPGLTDTADKNKDGSILSWDDLRRIAASRNATVGLTAYSYAHPDGQTEEILTADINRARARLREELGIKTDYFSYPFGDSTAAYLTVVKKQGFKAAFGQQSGAVGKSLPRFALPRFTMTDEFSGIDRFRMTASSLPLPVRDINPPFAYTHDNPPHPGFTIDESVSSEDLKQLRCFATGTDKTEIRILSGRRFEIRFPAPFDDNKARLNCTVPVSPAPNDGSEPRRRWLGFRFAFPE